jgi:2-oxoglutarate ferredoxin oxidoreductase subunit delta
MEKGIAYVDYETCMACGICVGACPFSYLELSKIDLNSLHKAYPVLTTDHKCPGCGICATACPVDSITIHN